MSDLDDYLTEEVRNAAAEAIAGHAFKVRVPDWYVADLALRAVLPDLLRQAKAEAWEEGAHTAWERSTPAVNGENYYWRRAGEPANPYRSDLEQGAQP